MSMTEREIFRAEALPVLQNRMFSAAAEALASPTGDVVLVQNPHSGLVYNQAFDPSSISYDRDYQNEQACSGTFQRHLSDVTGIITRHCQGRSLIEIGCGKGYFLEHLHDAGFDVTGIDPAYEGANPNVIKAHFERGLGLSADAIVLRHVLEHIPDPVSFLREIAAANGGAGVIYIEVPCFDWIRQRRAWFDIFYEHVNYFRLQDFHRIFGRVLESGRVFGGQYLFVIADLATLRTPSGAFDSAELPRDFLDGVNQAVALASTGGKRHAVWGGASKGLIFSLYLRRAGAAPDLVIDINPAKQGRYLAGSGLRVLAPGEGLARLRPGDVIFVMNSNYLDEIREFSGNQYSYIAVDHEAV